MRGLWGIVWWIIPCVFFCFCFFKVGIRLHTLITLFKPWSDHSGSASRDHCRWVDWWVNCRHSFDTCWWDQHHLVHQRSALDPVCDFKLVRLKTQNSVILLTCLKMTSWDLEVLSLPFWLLRGLANRCWHSATCFPSFWWALRCYMCSFSSQNITPSILNKLQEKTKMHKLEKLHPPPLKNEM